MIKSLTSRLVSFYKNISGATLIEYGVIVALISVVLIGSLVATGNGLKCIYGKAAQNSAACATAQVSTGGGGGGGGYG